MNQKSLLALAALCLATTAASAQTYGGIVIGSSHYSADCTGGTCDKSDTGFKLFGGYKLGNGFSAELSYVDYGKLKVSGSLNGSTVNGSVRGTGFGIGGAYTADFTSDVTGSLRLGLATNRTKVSASTGGASGSDSERSTQAYFGFGVGYKITPQATVELSYETTRFKYDGEGTTARLLGVGLTYAF